jgi:hypothetical protein
MNGDESADLGKSRADKATDSARHDREYKPMQLKGFRTNEATHGNPTGSNIAVCLTLNLWRPPRPRNRAARQSHLGGHA